LENKEQLSEHQMISVLPDLALSLKILHKIRRNYDPQCCIFYDSIFPHREEEASEKKQIIIRKWREENIGHFESEKELGDFLNNKPKLRKKLHDFIDNI
jgi:hypothetical protein